MVWFKMGANLESNTVTYNCKTILTSPSACMAGFDFIPLSKRGSIHANKNQNANSQRVSGQMPAWCPGAESGTGALSHIYPPTLQTAIPQHKMLHGFIRDVHCEQFLLFNNEHRVIFPRCTVLQCLNDWSMLLLRSPKCYYTNWSTTMQEMGLSLHLLKSEEIYKDLSEPLHSTQWRHLADAFVHSNLLQV